MQDHLPPPRRRVALFGATGTAGRATARALLHAGHAVIALGRSDPQMPDVPFLPFPLQDTSALAAVFAGHRINAVVSCLASRTGAPQEAWAIDHAAHMSILSAAGQAAVPQFVLLSALCVQKPRLAFQHAKLAFEEALISSGLTYSIVRPTAFFKSISGQLARVQAGKPYLMFGNGMLTACKPISDADLGAYIASCLVHPIRQNAVLPVGGPGPALTPLEMGHEMFRLTGRKPAFRRIPLAALRAITGAMALGGKLTPRLAAKAELARIGYYYASESMLYWDPDEGQYDEQATPETGSETLFTYYRNVLAGHETLERGDHAVF